jgi:hypothetical protein
MRGDFAAIEGFRPMSTPSKISSMNPNGLTNDRAAIWERAVMFDQKLSPTAARALLQVRFSEQDQQQTNVLSAKARAGMLSPHEQVDLDNYERLGCLLDIVHSKARIALKARRTSS